MIWFEIIKIYDSYRTLQKKRAISIVKLLVWIKFEEMISSYNVD